MWFQSIALAIAVSLSSLAAQALTDAELTTIRIFEETRDSVVAITTETNVIDPFRMRSSTQPSGSGSGFIWDDKGHIVTNDHVIDGATGATVLLADGRSYRASLVGRAPSHDLAVLRIDSEDLPRPLSQGMSADLKVGQSVLAIGNPFGLDWTLTTGIISSLGREIPGRHGRSIRGLIQSDAAINPGNSGGPLLDSSGRLIGVNTAIFSPSGASAGIGFSVPVSSVARVVPQLIETGRYAPPVIGIQYDAQLNAFANRQGWPGVVVLGVYPGSPAAEAGLVGAQFSRDGRTLPEDVIVGLDGRSIRTLDDLLAALDTRVAGTTVTLSLIRNGQSREVALTLAPGTSL